MRVRIISPAAVRAEMKSNAIAAVGVALVDLPLAFEPHPVFWIARAEMEGSAGTAITRSADPSTHRPRSFVIRMSWRCQCICRIRRSGLNPFDRQSFAAGLPG